jgi:hypothetical protein
LNVTVLLKAILLHWRYCQVHTFPIVTSSVIWPWNGE